MIVVPEITANNSSDAETEAAVAPTPTGDPQFQRLQMQEELAQFSMLIKRRSSISSLGGVDDGGFQQIFLPDHEPRPLPMEITTITRKKKENSRKRTKKKSSRGKQKTRRHESSDDKSAVFSEELTETLLKPPGKGKVVTAGTFPDQSPDSNPMLTAMLRQIDFAGVVWNEDNERGWDQRGPVEIEPVTVAVEVRKEACVCKVKRYRIVLYYISNIILLAFIDRLLRYATLTWLREGIACCRKMRCRSQVVAVLLEAVLWVWCYGAASKPRRDTPLKLVTA